MRPRSRVRQLHELEADAGGQARTRAPPPARATRPRGSAPGSGSRCREGGTRLRSPRPGSSGCGRSMKRPRSPRSTRKSCSRLAADARRRRAGRKGCGPSGEWARSGSPSTAGGGATSPWRGTSKRSSFAPRAGDVSTRTPARAPSLTPSRGLCLNPRAKLREANEFLVQRRPPHAHADRRPVARSTGSRFPSNAGSREDHRLGADSSHLRLTGRQRRHPARARSAWDATGVLLSDAGSAAGTYVNGEKVGASTRCWTATASASGLPGSPGQRQAAGARPPDRPRPRRMPHRPGSSPPRRRRPSRRRTRRTRRSSRIRRFRRHSRPPRRRRKRRRPATGRPSSSRRARRRRWAAARGPASAARRRARTRRAAGPRPDTARGGARRRARRTT